MELYFVCPVTGQSFSSSDYYLVNGYQVVDLENGEKQLQGLVKLRSGCPVCGKDHQFQASDVLCPMSGGQSEK